MKIFYIAFFVIIAVVGIAMTSIYIVHRNERDRLIGKQNAWADHINDSTEATFTFIPSYATVFVGTSITANWDVDNELPYLFPENRGIHSNTITHIRKRIPKICQYEPRAIVLEGGINDIYNGKDNAMIFAEIKDIIDSILIIAPKTQIYLTSILPVSSKGDSAKYNPIVREINQMVYSHVRFAHDAATKYPERAGNVLNLHYVDYYKNMTDDMYTDDVHLNSKGYLTLKHILIPFIHEVDSGTETKRNE